MTTIEIRPYTEADWPAVRDIYDLSKPDEMRGAVDLTAIVPLEQDPGALALFSDSTIVVATEATSVIGFGGHKGSYISWLFVHPEHRRKGVAQALLMDILQVLTGSITLNVVPTNRAARALYERAGFRVEREFGGTFNGHDVQVMTLRAER